MNGVNQAAVAAVPPKLIRPDGMEGNWPYYVSSGYTHNLPLSLPMARLALVLAW